MKLMEIVDRGDMALNRAWEQRQGRSQDMHAKHVKGYWLLDRKTGKKLSGPFGDHDKAESFKSNRSDKIPSDAVIREL